MLLSPSPFISEQIEHRTVGYPVKPMRGRERTQKHVVPVHCQSLHHLATLQMRKQRLRGRSLVKGPTRRKRLSCDLSLGSLSSQSDSISIQPSVKFWEEFDTESFWAGRNQLSPKAFVFIFSSQDMAREWRTTWLEFETGGLALLCEQMLRWANHWTSLNFILPVC